MLELLVLCKKNNAFIPTVPDIIKEHKKNLEDAAAARKAKAKKSVASTSSSSLSAAASALPTLYKEDDLDDDEEEEDEDETEVLLGFMFDQPTSWKFEENLTLTARQLNDLENDYLPSSTDDTETESDEFEALVSEMLSDTNFLSNLPESDDPLTFDGGDG